MPPSASRGAQGANGISQSPLKPAGDRSVVETDAHRACEHCGSDFTLNRPDRHYKRRFCTDRCQRANQAKRAYHQKPHGEDAVSVGAVLGANVHRLLAAGARR